MHHSDPTVMCRSRTAVAPLERLKILMQVQGNAKVYTGVWQVCAVLKAGLPISFWNPSCCMSLPGLLGLGAWLQGRSYIHWQQDQLQTPATH